MGVLWLRVCFYDAPLCGHLESSYHVSPVSACFVSVSGITIHDPNAFHEHHGDKNFCHLVSQ